MIYISNLCFSFKKKVVLDEFSISFDRGITGILGPNGAGKTSLFRCICGLYENYKGKIKIDKIKNAENNINIGYLPQHFSVVPYIKVKNIMEYYSVIKGIERSKREAEIERALKFVHLELYKSIYGHALSGGMLRRLGIAIAIILNFLDN